MAYHPFRHLGLKMLSLALATLLWLTVAGEHVVERSLRVPLEFRNIPPQLEIVGDPPDTSTCALRGSSARPRPAASRAKSSRCSISPAARPGSRLFHLRNDEVRAPFGVEVAQVLPATRLARARAVGDAHGAGRAGASTASRRPASSSAGVTAEPATVEVVGPESRVRAAGRGDDRAGQRSPGAATRVRDVVTVGVTDSAVRLDAAVRTRLSSSRVLPAPVERELDRRAGPLAESRRRAAARRCVPSVAKVTRARPARGARRAARGRRSRRSWTLPGSAPAGTICAFRSIQPSTSGSTRSRPASSR